MEWPNNHIQHIVADAPNADLKRCSNPGAEMENEVQITIKDVPLECKHCGSGHFAHRRAQLNTAAMTFLNLDWLNASADIYVCERCGYLHWFLGSSTTDTELEDAPCLSCGASIPPEVDACPKCGWSYDSSENGT